MTAAVSPERKEKIKERLEKKGIKDKNELMKSAHGLSGINVSIFVNPVIVKEKKEKQAG